MAKLSAADRDQLVNDIFEGKKDPAKMDPILISMLLDMLIKLILSFFQKKTPEEKEQAKRAHAVMKMLRQQEKANRKAAK